MTLDTLIVLCCLFLALAMFFGLITRAYTFLLSFLLFLESHSQTHWCCKYGYEQMQHTHTRFTNIECNG